MTLDGITAFCQRSGKRMLKILQISNKAPFPANDGSSIAIYNMARGLLQNGIDLRVLTINTKKHFKPDSGVPSEFREKVKYRSVFHNTNVTTAGAFFNLFSGRSYFVSRFFFREFSKVLAETLSKDQFDIVQIEGLFMASYIPVIRKHSKARIVLRAHNIEHVIWERHIAGEKSLLKRIYLSAQNRRLRKFEMKAFRQVDAVVTITSADENNIRNAGCDKPIFTCITGIDPMEYGVKGVQKPRKGTVFYFGSMDWLPNQEAVTWFLHNCWVKVKQAVPSARFVIAGRGMPLQFYHINKPGVSIIEQVEDPHEFYRLHEVMIVPLWSGSGLRIKIVEGMASGKAIVSTSIGAEGIPCVHGSHILIADTADDFARQVISLLSDHDLRMRIGDQAAQLAGHEFDNRKVVGELSRFYTRLLNV